MIDNLTEGQRQYFKKLEEARRKKVEIDTSKKYTLTDKRVLVRSGVGKKIPYYQIQANRDIPEANVKAGGLGGYIKDESSLSQEDNSWIDNGFILMNTILENSIIKNFTNHKDPLIIRNSSFKNCNFALGQFCGAETIGLEKWNAENIIANKLAISRENTIIMDFSTVTIKNLDASNLVSFNVSLGSSSIDIENIKFENTPSGGIFRIDTDYFNSAPKSFTLKDTVFFNNCTGFKVGTTNSDSSISNCFINNMYRITLNNTKLNNLRLSGDDELYLKLENIFFTSTSGLATLRFEKIAPDTKGYNGSGVYLFKDINTNFAGLSRTFKNDKNSSKYKSSSDFIKFEGQKAFDDYMSMSNDKPETLATTGSDSEQIADYLSSMDSGDFQLHDANVYRASKLSHVADDAKKQANEDNILNKQNQDKDEPEKAQSTETSSTNDKHNRWANIAADADNQEILNNPKSKEEITQEFGNTGKGIDQDTKASEFGETPKSSDDTEPKKKNRFQLIGDEISDEDNEAEDNFKPLNKDDDTTRKRASLLELKDTTFNDFVKTYDSIYKEIKEKVEKNIAIPSNDKKYYLDLCEKALSYTGKNSKEVLEQIKEDIKTIF